MTLPGGPLAPSPLEVATCWLYGVDGTAPPLPAPATATALDALAACVRPALERPPCVVAFSGGRDSSAVLAVAATAARREGLPLPVPVTVEVDGVAGMEESGWQELVVRHLRLDDWVRCRVAADELDLVGPVARRTLARHGLLYPPTFPLLTWPAGHACGGTLLTGVGGDAILGGWRHAGTWRSPVGGDRSAAAPGPRLARAAYALSPRPARARLLVRARPRAPFPWLRPDAQRLATRAWAGAEAEEPARFDRYLEWRARLRRMRAVERMTRVVGADAGAAVLNPLMEPPFLAALARAGGRTGLGDRARLMRVLFAGVLPDAVVARRDKARADTVWFRDASREVARAWDGGGVDAELVDPAALRAAWLAPAPDLRSALALQTAWLARAAAFARPDC